MNELYRTLLYLPPQASTVASEIDYLHYFVITTTMLGAVAVTIAVLIFLFRFHEGRRHQRRPGAIPAARAGIPFGVELMVIFALLGLFLAFWIVGFRQFVRLQQAPDDTLEIYVVGKQWMWAFAYPDGTISNGELRVPANQPIKLVMTSRDVIHSFFVPAFRVKQDVIPGRMTTLWFEAVDPGIYDIYCTEYCGAYHSTMRGRVVVLPPEEYADWKEEQEDIVDLAALGRQVAVERGCLRCHTTDGSAFLGPTWAGLYGATIPLAGGGTVRADEAYLTESMMDPLVKIHEGFSPIMPSYQGQLTAPETAALVEYIRALAGREPVPAFPGAPGLEGLVPMAVPGEEQPRIEDTGLEQPGTEEHQPAATGGAP